MRFDGRLFERLRLACVGDFNEAAFGQMKKKTKPIKSRLIKPRMRHPSPPTKAVKLEGERAVVKQYRGEPE